MSGRSQTVLWLGVQSKALRQRRKALEGDLVALDRDLTHIDALLSIASRNDEPLMDVRHVLKQPAKRGAVRSHVLTMLRQADGPVTSREITVAWARAHGLATDEVSFVVLRRRLGACLTALQAVGLVTARTWDGGRKGWELVRDG